MLATLPQQTEAPNASIQVQAAHACNFVVGFVLRQYLAIVAVGPCGEARSQRLCGATVRQQGFTPFLSERVHNLAGRVRHGLWRKTSRLDIQHLPRLLVASCPPYVESSAQIDNRSGALSALKTSGQVPSVRKCEA